ncbi:unnamed protein product [Amoebophrya sp. A25]|nr:unnamed protein product [Amoebophrya sp. A25]|eukprot:GSA25T00013100001.1
MPGPSFKYGQHRASLRGADKVPISDAAWRKSSARIVKAADVSGTKYSLDALTDEGVPCLFYDQALRKFDMRTLKVDPKLHFIHVLEKQSAHVDLAKVAPWKSEGMEPPLMIRLVAIKAVHSGAEGLRRCQEAGLDHDLLDEDTAVVIEYDPQGFLDEQMGAPPLSPTTARSSKGRKVLEQVGTKVVSFFGGAPKKLGAAEEEDGTGGVQFAYLLKGPKTDIGSVLQTALNAIDFKTQAADGAKLVQGLLRVKRLRRVVLAMTKTKRVEKISIVGGTEQMLANVYEDEMREDIVELAFKGGTHIPPYAFPVSPSEWSDGSTDTIADKVAQDTRITRMCRHNLARFLHECQLFYLAIRKFDPVALKFLLSKDAAKLEMRVPSRVLDAMAMDVQQLRQSFHGSFADRRVAASLTRCTALACQKLVDLERLYDETLATAADKREVPLATEIDLPQGTVVEETPAGKEPSEGALPGVGEDGNPVSTSSPNMNMADAEGGPPVTIENEASSPSFVTATAAQDGVTEGRTVEQDFSREDTALTVAPPGVADASTRTNNNNKSKDAESLQSGRIQQQSPDAVADPPLSMPLSMPTSKPADGIKRSEGSGRDGSHTATIEDGEEGDAPDLAAVRREQRERSMLQPEKDGLPCCACREGADDIECCVM